MPPPNAATSATSVSITVAALVLGKSVVIADLLSCINRYPEKPLIWNVCWKTTIYSLGLAPGPQS